MSFRDLVQLRVSGQTCVRSLILDSMKVRKMVFKSRCVIVVASTRKLPTKQRYLSPRARRLVTPTEVRLPARGYSESDG
jgi:hypothetical protein